jgi:CRP-like cAMP-binding protein
MKTPIPPESAELIHRFSPLNNIPPKYHAELVQGMQVESVATGKTLFKKNRPQNKGDDLLHFLIEGSVEVRESFDKRQLINSSDKNISSPLQSFLPKSGSVKTTSECQILVVNNLLLDQLLELGQDYAVYYLDEGEVSLGEHTLIDDNFQEDWDDVFIRSHLASNLPNQVSHQLISALEDIIVTANQQIVKAKSPGDYFYVVKQGVASVVTAANGPFKGSTFPLNTGQYFGDEALVAGTPRNADVVMATDGILGRLNAEAFNELIKPYLVPALHDKLKLDSDYKKIIDVRFSAEYQQGHIAGSDNIPICYLRQQLNKLPKSCLYIISPANDSRAELATYIMRQAGYQAYYQNDDLFRLSLS